MALRTLKLFMLLLFFAGSALAQESLRMEELRGYKAAVAPYGQSFKPSDTAVAEFVFEEYLQQQTKVRNQSIDQVKHALADCIFKIDQKQWTKYHSDQNGDTITSALRDHEAPYVMFEQSEFITEKFLPPENFKPSTNKTLFDAWLKFFSSNLQGLNQSYSTYAKERKSLQGDMGVDLDYVKVSAPSLIAADVREYLKKTFLISSAQIQYTPVSGEYNYAFAYEFRKITFPKARSYRYGVFKVVACEFHDKKAEAPVQSDTTYTDDEDRKISDEWNHIKVTNEVGKSTQTPGSTTQSTTKGNKKKVVVPTQATDEDLPQTGFFSRKESPGITNQNSGPAVLPTNEDEQIYLKKFRDVHRQNLTNSEFFKNDQANLKVIRDFTTEEANQKIAKMNENRSPKKLVKIKSVQLDPKLPFKKHVMVVNVPIHPSDISIIEKLLQGPKYKDLVGCKVYVQELNVWIECLTPNYVAYAIDPLGYTSQLKTRRPSFRRKLAGPTACGSKKPYSNFNGECKEEVFQLVKISNPERTFTFAEPTLPPELILISDIEGYVFDNYSKKPLQNANVLIQNRNGTTYSAVTDESGYYKVAGMDLRYVGRNEVGSKDPKYVSNSIKISYALDSVKRQVPLMLDPKRVTLIGTLTPSKQLKYPPPLSRLTVDVPGLWGDHFSSAVDDQGNYKIENVPVTMENQNWTSKEDRGFDPGSKTIDIPVPKDLTQPVSMGDQPVDPIPTTVLGRVTNLKGKPAPGVNLDIQNSSGPTSVADDNGNYSFEDIPAKDLKVLVNDPNRNHDPGKFTLDGILEWARNETPDLQVKENKSDISGTAFDLRTKAPIPGILVTVEGSNGKYSAVTDSSGNYDIRFVPEKYKTLKFSDPNDFYISDTLALSSKLEAGKDLENQNQYLMPKDYTFNKIILVVTWGPEQWDIDSQIFTPSGFHLFYKNIRANDLATTGVDLDQDDVNTSGREITVLPLTNGQTTQGGEYRYLLYQYRDSGKTFQGGKVKVKSYQDGKLVGTYTPSGAPGRVWYVGNVRKGSEGRAEFHKIDQFPGSEKFEQINQINDQKVLLVTQLDKLQKQKDDAPLKAGKLQAEYDAASEIVRINKPVLEEMKSRKTSFEEEKKQLLAKKKLEAAAIVPSEGVPIPTKESPTDIRLAEVNAELLKVASPQFASDLKAMIKKVSDASTKVSSISGKLQSVKQQIEAEIKAIDAKMKQLNDSVEPMNKKIEKLNAEIYDQIRQYF